MNQIIKSIIRGIPYIIGWEIGRPLFPMAINIENILAVLTFSALLIMFLIITEQLITITKKKENK